MKINAIKTPVVRKIMSTAMLAAATLGTSVVTAKNISNDSNEVSTEKISQATKAYSPLTRTISHDVNEKLDNRYLSLARNGIYFLDEENEMKDIELLYQNYGSFGEAFLVQTEINKLALNEFTQILSLQVKEKDLSDEQFNRYIESKLKITSWLEKEFGKVVESKLSRSLFSVPSAEDISLKLDSVIEDPKIFSEEEKLNYYNEVKKFKSQQKTSGTQAWSDLIAFKTFIINKIAIDRKIVDLGLNSYSGYDYAYKTFLEKATPTP
ncbi:MAG: hypothetical protein E7Z92_03040 [Cyanobacteria bacterium SIG31]|nr:hypothetical protein [Cyanobacteria bacterium SIG31]